ncbi:2-polyprenyl-3-methyl-5-hydroxy-6-metoxy-1,4-benzoquinol methylase [Virgibacillus natechei]|uniref:2-polyprenyl-3-methyl-5-hydroxy-6-metoxy-1, 4-benzoquinol methylase n=1 Tax=Virgibacillus natechei TaxID=1216297 RepID=A0ABS4IJ44_9BACI|nr:methyltransferase domain-containing protein [Virgibacillus natechei]MBP1970969.1 2-polyprenyl-3-methyl-5-hydroxy-6-metoxy-1,4-benzoquinol methylase [Virgibacillus natechei]UZD12737.1 methyltransferase domain-containing protein [Virgibacillus natechei]
MTINFHNPDNKDSYSTRKADTSWHDTIKKMIDMQDIHYAVDVSCGGGIYSRALTDMGVAAVTGVDFSRTMIEEPSLSKIGPLLTACWVEAMIQLHLESVFSFLLLHQLTIYLIKRNTLFLMFLILLDVSI